MIGRMTWGVAVLAAVAMAFALPSFAKDVWVGTAPFCKAKPSDCAARGMTFVRKNSKGSGKKCVSGTKVLCRTWKFGDKKLTTWKGTAPACEAQSTSCPANMLYVKSSKSGDGKKCTSGQKVQCVTRSLTTRQLSTWMGLAKAKIGAKKLNEIIIPGTHDSGSATISAKSAIAPDKSDWYFKAIPPTIMAAWGKTQVYKVADQLTHGARSIDIRVCKVKKDVYYTCHGKYGESLSAVLGAIQNFSAANRSEVILVHVTHFYGFASNNAQDHANVADKIYNTFAKGGNMVPRDRSLPTFNDIWKTNARVMVHYDNVTKNIAGNSKLNDKSNKEKKFWYSSSVLGNYACASDSKGWTKKSKLRSDQAKWIKGEKIGTCSKPSSANLRQVVSALTPDGSYYAGAIARWKPQNLLQVNGDLNGAMANWLDKEWKSDTGFIMPIDSYGRTVLHEKIIKKYIQ